MSETIITLSVLLGLVTAAIACIIALIILTLRKRKTNRAIEDR